MSIGGFVSDTVRPYSVGVTEAVPSAGSEAADGDSPVAPERARPGVGRLLERVWRSVLTNRGLVVAIIALGLAQAFFTKAPILLLQPLIHAVAPQTALAGAFDQGLTAGFLDLSLWLCDLFGIQFDPEEPNFQAKVLCLGCAMVTLFVGLLGAVTIYGTLVLTRFFALKLVVDLRNEVATHMLRLPLSFFGVRRQGELISHITTDTTVLSRALMLAVDHVVVDPLLVLGNAGIIAFVMPEAAWVVLLMAPAMALPLIRMGRRVQRRSRSSLEAMGGATESMNQMLSGIRTVKAFQLERERLRDFEQNNEQYMRRTVRMLKTKALSQASLFAGYQAGFAVILCAAALWAVGAESDLGQLAVVITAAGTTYTHVKRLARAYNVLMESLGALERIDSVLDELPDAGSMSGGQELEAVRGDVAFEKVSFSYGREPVLREVSFVARAGETVAFVGPSGAGKSTALDLLARFYDPSSGRILIDGHDLRDLDAAGYRRHFAIVSQQPFLFNATIYDNIRFGRPDATEDEIVAAARGAQIHDFLEGLPDGYRSMAGERGCNLSGGQMQRITIARAILRDPEILILDEATSALDSESEEAVQKALLTLMEGRTSFVIAHRLSTVSTADQIVVMDRGRIVESGKHAELIGQNGLYARLSQLQQMS